MRRTVLLLVSIAITLLLVSGVALAATVMCPTREGGWCDGTSENDEMYGTTAPDYFLGSGGNDYMEGQDGPDRVYGDYNDGDDTSVGGEGSDFFQEYAGNNTMSGGDDDDFLVGGPGIDIINGDAGPDDLRGGWGGDTIHGGGGSDWLDGGNDADSLYGDGGNDTIWTSKGFHDGVKDIVACGRGKSDRVVFEKGIDQVARDCEIRRPF